MSIRFVLTHPSYLTSLLRVKFLTWRNPELPWLTRDSINLLSTLLRPGDCGLEWGSGRSTLWFSRRVRHLISVEHNRPWFERVQQMLDGGGSNVDLRLCEVPDDQVPAVDGQENAYVRVTDGMAPESLDFALVDGGLSRDQCLHRAIPLLKPGGILILDNANWYLNSDSKAPGSVAKIRTPSQSATWDSFQTKVATWRHIWTTDGVTCTALWIKP